MFPRYTIVRVGKNFSFLYNYMLIMYFIPYIHSWLNINNGEAFLPILDCVVGMYLLTMTFANTPGVFYYEICNNSIVWLETHYWVNSFATCSSVYFSSSACGSNETSVNSTWSIRFYYSCFILSKISAFQMNSVGQNPRVYLLIGSPTQNGRIWVVVTWSKLTNHIKSWHWNCWSVEMKDQL